MEGALSGEASFELLGLLLAANSITFWFFWAAWRISRHERETGSARGAEWPVYLGLIVPPLFVALAGYLGMTA